MAEPNRFYRRFDLGDSTLTVERFKVARCVELKLYWTVSDEECGQLTAELTPEEIADVKRADYDEQPVWRIGSLSLSARRIEFHHFTEKGAWRSCSHSLPPPGFDIEKAVLPAIREAVNFVNQQQPAEPVATEA